jgi:hypothetical protein
MTVGVLQAALLMACEQATPGSDPSSKVMNEAGQPAVEARDEADAIALGQVGLREPAAKSPAEQERWSWTYDFDPTTRLIVRTGQASIEVDSLEPAMAELRRIAQRVGGFVADASVQSGRDQLRRATLELKVPSSRFDELTEGLQPIGRLEFVNVGAEDVSEEFVDLTARVTNGRRRIAWSSCCAPAPASCRTCSRSSASWPGCARKSSGWRGACAISRPARS